MAAWRRSRKYLKCLILVAILGTGGPVFGDTDHVEESRQAKALRDQGAAAVKAHDFAGALDFFERAYALRPSPNMLFNIGAALDRLDRADRAVAAFEEFLATATHPPAVAREFAQARLAALEPRVARLALVVTPADAAVTVDGQRVTTKTQRALPLLPGERIVVATRDGYLAARHTMTLTAGEKRQLELSLAPDPTAVPPTPPKAAPPLAGASSQPAPDVSLTRPPLPVRPDPLTLRRWRRVRLAGIGVGTFGLAALAVGAGMASLAATTADGINHPRAGMMFDPSLATRGEAAQALAISFFAVGGAATIGGLTLFLVARQRESHVR